MERVARALREVTDREQSPDLSDDDRELLARTLGEVSAAIGADRSGDQLLHGEPHEGNLLATERGPLFVDLATCSRGPVEFDLARAPDGVAEHYAGADRDLLHRCHAVDLGHVLSLAPAPHRPDARPGSLEGGGTRPGPCLARPPRTGLTLRGCRGR